MSYEFWRAEQASRRSLETVYRSRLRIFGASGGSREPGQNRTILSPHGKRTARPSSSSAARRRSLSGRKRGRTPSASASRTIAVSEDEYKAALAGGYVVGR